MTGISLKSTDMVTNNNDPSVFLDGRLMGDIRELIESSKSRFAEAANAALVTLYWNVGKRIKTDILGNERAQYGREIVVSLTRQLSWTHFVALIPMKDPLQREFYAEMCRVERWSVRTLRKKINSMLYERTAISRKPAQLARQELDSLHNDDRMTPDLVFRDPYLLDFLGLTDTYSERDLESVILVELERFLLELGTDFSFVARQKRITIDNEDYYIDLLFYHRGMHCLVVIELKLGKFQAADKGQMELYLRWLDKYEKREGEGMPLGLILCAEKSYEHVELLRLEESEIHIAEYLTELPPINMLEAKLHEAIRMAREQIAVREVSGLEGAK
jgi:predicted nuclease of restriction endonuclease-like (RecB) superfamily